MSKTLNSDLQIYKNLGKKDFSDWVKANNAANPNVQNNVMFLAKRNLLIDLYEKVLLEPYVSTPVTHRTEAFLAEKFMLVDANGNNNEEAVKLIDHFWLYKLNQEIINARFFGYTLAEIHFDRKGYVENVESIERRNIVPDKKLVLKNPYDMTGFEFETSKYKNNLLWIEDTSNQFGILNKIIIPSLHCIYASAFWAEQAEKAGLPLIVLKLAGNDTAKFQEMQEMLRKMGRDGMLMAGVEDEISLLNRNQTGHQIYYEFLKEKKKEIAETILGQSGTSTGGSSNYKESFNNADTELLYMESDARFKEHVYNDILLPTLSKFKNYEILRGLTFKRHREEILSFSQKLQVYQAAKSDPNIKVDVEALNKMFPHFNFSAVDITGQTPDSE